MSPALPDSLTTAVLNWSGGTFGFGSGFPGFASLSSEGESNFAGGAGGGGPEPIGLLANDNSTINIFGYDLDTILIDPNYQKPFFNNTFSVYQLVGRLADGTPLDGGVILVANETGASLHLLPPVPEPASALLLGFAAAWIGIAWRRTVERRN